MSGQRARGTLAGKSAARTTAPPIGAPGPIPASGSERSTSAGGALRSPQVSKSRTAGASARPPEAITIGSRQVEPRRRKTRAPGPSVAGTARSGSSGVPAAASRPASGSTKIPEAGAAGADSAAASTVTMKAFSADPPEFSTRTVTISPALALPVPSVRRAAARVDPRAAPRDGEKQILARERLGRCPTAQSAPAVSEALLAQAAASTSGAARVTRRAGVTASRVPTVTRQLTSLRSSSGPGT